MNQEKCDRCNSISMPGDELIDLGDVVLCNTCGMEDLFNTGHGVTSHQANIVPGIYQAGTNYDYRI